MRIKANLSNFAASLSECIEQTQIYLNFIVNMWKLSNAYTRHRILTHFGHHRCRAALTFTKIIDFVGS